MAVLLIPERKIISQTRKGRDIPNAIGQKFLPFEVEKQRGLLREAIKQQYKGVLPRERKTPTGVYNCHGLTFLNRRAELNEPDAVERILEDDEYVEVLMERALPGDIVVYREPNREISHTGVVLLNEENRPKCPLILSKWGKAGEYIHRYTDCPYYMVDSVVVFMREGQND